MNLFEVLGCSFFGGAKKSTQTFFVQSFSKTLRVMDVRAENRGRPQQKVRFSAAPVTGRNFLTQGRPGVRVRNVRGKSGPKSLCLCCFSSLIIQKHFKTVTVTVILGNLIQMTFKTVIGNQWKWRGDCGRQDGNGNGNSSEFQDGNGNGNLGK